MNPEFNVKIGRKNYPILFIPYGLTKLERECGLTLVDLAKAIDIRVDPKEYREATEEQQSRLIGAALQKLSLYKLQALLYAGLEGGRWQFNRSEPPFDFDEVGDLIIDAGGYQALSEPLIIGFATAMPKIMGVEEQEEKTKNPPRTRRKTPSTGKKS